MDRSNYCRHSTNITEEFCEWCEEEKKEGAQTYAEIIKQAALENTNELLKKYGMEPIDLAKEAIKRKESIEPRIGRSKNE